MGWNIGIMLVDCLPAAAPSGSTPELSAPCQAASGLASSREAGAVLSASRLALEVD